MSDLGQKLVEIVRRKAAESPDFVYASPAEGGCYYIYDGQPSCILGHALFAAGLIDVSLRGRGLNECTFHALAERLELLEELDADEFWWLCHVQREQDAKRSWGDAVASADTRQAYLSK